MSEMEPIRNVSQAQGWRAALAAPRQLARNWQQRHPRAWRTLSLAVVLLLGWLAWRAWLDLPAATEINPAALWPLMLLVLATWVCNAQRMRWSFVAVAAPTPSRLEALRLAGQVTLANNLPLPGGLLIRVAAMKSELTRYSDIGRVTVASLVFWLASVLLVAAPGAAFQAGWIGPSLVLAAAATLLLGLRSIPMIAPRLRWQLFLVELCMVLLELLRLWLCFSLISQEVRLIDAGVLAAASLLGSAAGFLPGGFGVREGATVLLGMGIGIAPAAAFLAALVNRLAGLALLTLAAPWLMRRASDTAGS